MSDKLQNTKQEGRRDFLKGVMLGSAVLGVAS